MRTLPWPANRDESCGVRQAGDRGFSDGRGDEHPDGAPGDRILVKLDRNHPEHYQNAVGDLAPDTEVHILPTGQVLKL